MATTRLSNRVSQRLVKEGIPQNDRLNAIEACLLGSFKFFIARPDFLVRRAQDTEDFVDLLNL